MDHQNASYNGDSADSEELFSIKDFLSQCAFKWRWFLASVIILCFIGAVYILRQQPQYVRSMSVLIKDQEGGATAADLSSAFSSMGLVASNTNVNNELISLTSPAILAEVIQRLGLEVNYNKKGTFHRITLYGTTLPVVVSFPDLDAQADCGFDMVLNPDGSAELSKFYNFDERGKKQKYEKTIKCAAGFQELSTPIGKITIRPNGAYIPKSDSDGKPMEMKIWRMGLQNTVEFYQQKVSGDLADKDAEVIDLSMEDVSTQRAVDVLNMIVTVYNENWVEDKNRVAVATSNFIDERLKVIEQELGVVDDDISAFKSEHLIPDPEEAVKLAMKETVDMSKDILDVTNQMAMSNYLKEFLANPSNQNSVIPVNTGIGSQQVESQITAYNNLLLNRNNLASNSSDKNPLVEDYDVQLKGLRQSIVGGVNVQISSLNAALKNMKGAKGDVSSQLASGPTQAKYLLSVERQQKVKEALYLYLLQKREENELTQTFTAYNTRIITPPTGSLRPVAPKKVLILGVCFILGLAIPGVVIYVSETLNTKVRSRKDLESLSIPFAGEIPLVTKKKRFGFLPAKKEKTGRNGEKALAVVQEGNRDAVNESFRIIRGNLDFMMGHKNAGNVIMMTSFNPGSGKSFISFNLAVSFALKGKKVLIIDGDLRHGSLSQYVGMPRKGISDYLTENTDNWQSLVVPVKDASDTFVLPIGHRPPNPSELLDNDRLKVLFDEARKIYDYVLIDCPPVDIVVDTQIVERYVDRTIFIIRAGLFDKKAIAELDAIYKDKRFKQLSVILNATDNAHSRGYYYGSYGYHNNYYNS